MQARTAVRVGWCATMAVASMLWSLAAHGWWHDEWAYRKALHVEPAQAAPAFDGVLTEVPVLLRLHMGNFPYFNDLQPQGGDLRFIAGDDETPLPYAVEFMDTAAGLAAIWVRLPALDPVAGATIYMYYGNAEARSAQDPAQFWGPETIALFHFNERAEGHRDATAFGQHPLSDDSSAGEPGFLGSAAGFQETSSFAFLDPRFARSLSDGFTLSAWLKPTRLDDQRSLFRLGAVTVTLKQGFLAATGPNSVIQATMPLKEGLWQHVTVRYGGGAVTLLMDGRPMATGALPMIAGESPVIFGASVDGDGVTGPGYVGLLDELRLQNTAVTDDQLRFQALSQREDTTLVRFGEDEIREAASNGYFELLTSIASTIRIEGWLIIAVLLLVGLMSFDIAIVKSFELGRAERRDKSFQQRLAAEAAGDEADDELLVKENTERSPDPEKLGPLESLYRTFQAERSRMPGHLRTNAGQSALLEAMRSTLDTQIAATAERLNRRLAVMTVAVSGGPFLGLLGTVVGVMVTFAAISAAGDVNVRTIAPGVAAALTTTVLGLLVAIPSLFAYNNVAGRITRRMTALEVYADRLVAQLALELADPDHQTEKQRVQAA